MGLFKRKEKPTIFYGLCPVTNPGKIITITTKEEECIEYVINLMVTLHGAHYNSWIECHDYKDSYTTRLQYYQQIIGEEERNAYAVRTLSYGKAELAALLRMFMHCVPLNCSYDLPQEYAWFEDCLSKDGVEVKHDN